MTISLLTNRITDITSRAAAREQLPKRFLLPHRGKQGRCPDCGGRVQGIRVAGRTARYCPRCQPE